MAKLCVLLLLLYGKTLCIVIAIVWQNFVYCYCYCMAKLCVLLLLLYGKTIVIAIVWQNFEYCYCYCMAKLCVLLLLLYGKTLCIVIAIVWLNFVYCYCYCMAKLCVLLLLLYGKTLCIVFAIVWQNFSGFSQYLPLIFQNFFLNPNLRIKAKFFQSSNDLSAFTIVMANNVKIIIYKHILIRSSEGQYTNTHWEDVSQRFDSASQLLGNYPGY